jgi:hypothetical protein
MARDGFLSRVGVALGCLVAAAVVGLLVVAWYQRSRPNATAAPAVATRRSEPGWETRYTATVALARRGSERVRERLGVFAEMLDEEQQLQNFRTRLKDGREVANVPEAYQTLTNGLRALVELHRKRPEFDFSALHPAVQKLAENDNAALRNEAARAKVELGIN